MKPTAWSSGASRPRTAPVESVSSWRSSAGSSSPDLLSRNVASTGWKTGASACGSGSSTGGGGVARFCFGGRFASPGRVAGEEARPFFALAGLGLEQA